MNNLLLSAAIGDIAGEPYEFDHPTKHCEDVDLLRAGNTYTDDTVCTFACAEALLHHQDVGLTLRARCRADRHRGYGGRFDQWLTSPAPQPPYGSFGNGSAMRVAAAGFMATSEEECISLANTTALPTHNHPEGIKGAVATALAIYHAMNGKPKAYIKQHVLDSYYPTWAEQTYAAIQPTYTFDETCQLTVPPALICFLESTDYAHSLKLAIALGGDADTLAAIVGPIAYAHYKHIPNELILNAQAKLPQWMLRINQEMDAYVNAVK